MRDSVTVHMAAPPERVWNLVSDVTNTGKFSPETFECVWNDGSSGPAVGARFRGHVKRNSIGPVYWTNCTVTACEPGREFAFGVVTPKGAVINTWTYRFEPAGDGTDVTESFELTPTRGLRLYWALLGWARGPHNVKDMRTTLERIKAVVESSEAESPDPAA
jgi:ligand-binding SRPBCC domain-containing protein